MANTLTFPLDDTRPETLRQVLWATRHLLAPSPTENAWIQTEWATGDHGDSHDPRAIGACRFCLAGALSRVLDYDMSGIADEADPLPLTCLTSLARLMYVDGQLWTPDNIRHPLDHITMWNDTSHRTWHQVLRILDIALDLLPERDERRF